jgi:hypothetical protein
MGKRKFEYIVLATLLVLFSSGAAMRTNAQPQQGSSAVAETDDPVKIAVYSRFRDNYRGNIGVAYQAARDYLQRYGKENDLYVKYLSAWVAAFEKDQREKDLLRLAYTDRNFIEAFKIGKQVLAEQPDHLASLIALGNAGYLAATARNENYNTEGAGYARRAIQLIESGKVPESWEPFKGKDDTLAQLYYTVGVLSRKTAPNEALAALIRSTQFESELKKDPVNYFLIAGTYESGPYAKLSADYQSKYAGQPETPQSKAALDILNQVIDRMVDAYARAVATSGTDPKNQPTKTAAMSKLTVFYKFRHQDSEAGLNEFIASVMSRPLPPAL